MWLHTLPRAGSWDRNLIAAERAANELEPYASEPLGLQVLGMITLSASLAAASIQRGDTALHWLDEASGIARRLPDQPMDNWQSFSATNVNIWRVSVGVERGEGRHDHAGAGKTGQVRWPRAPVVTPGRFLRRRGARTGS